LPADLASRFLRGRIRISYSAPGTLALEPVDEFPDAETVLAEIMERTRRQELPQEQHGHDHEEDDQ